MKIIPINVFIVALLTFFSLFAMHKDKSARTTHGVVQQWNGTHYDEHCQPQRQAALEFLESTRIKIADYTSILDAGCGSGWLTHHLAMNAPDCIVEGIDADPTMIEVARRYYGSLKNIQFEIGDIQNLSYKNKFNLVVCLACLHWIKNKTSAFKKFSRSLQPGGLLLIQSSRKPTTPRILAQAFHDLKALSQWSSVKLSGHYYPLEKANIKEEIKKAKLDVVLVEEVEGIHTFKSKDDMVAWVLGWAKLKGTSAATRTAFISALIDRYAYYVPPAANGSITYQWGGLRAQARKPHLSS